VPCLSQFLSATQLTRKTSTDPIHLTKKTAQQNKKANEYVTQSTYYSPQIGSEAKIVIS